MSDTVKINLTSPLNISFRHQLDTQISRDEWGEMSEREQDEVVADLVFQRAIEAEVEQ